jgi:hypothetical protein
MAPNGLELSCPAAQATVAPFSRILAGQSPSNFPRASRVSCSELLGATRRRSLLGGPLTARRRDRAPCVTSQDGESIVVRINCLSFQLRSMNKMPATRL